MEEKMREENQEMAGVFLEKDYSEIKKLTERAKTRNIIKKVVLWIIAVVIGYLLLNYSLEIFGNIVNGQSTIWEFIQTISVLILAACAIVYTMGFALTDFRFAQKDTNIRTYLKVLRVYDKQELFQKLNSLNLKEVKKVFYDEKGNIGIQGRLSMYSFMLQESPMVYLDFRKEHYRVAAEAETIVAELLKKIDPDIPLNAYDIQKRNNLLIKQRMYLLIFSIISGLLFAIPVFKPELLAGKDAYIEMVQDCCPEIYPDVSYGEAFDNYFSSPEWEYFETEDGEQVVEFNGQCLFLDENADVKVQFLLTDLENEDHEYKIEICYLGINDISQVELVQLGFFADIFENYDDANSSSEEDI